MDVRNDCVEKVGFFLKLIQFITLAFRYTSTV